jgi:regulator of sigma D
LTSIKKINVYEDVVKKELEIVIENTKSIKNFNDIFKTRDIHDSSDIQVAILRKLYELLSINIELYGKKIHIITNVLFLKELR